MDVKKYRHYLSEISALYSISKVEAEAIFKSAVARAYNAIGSAYIWDDGTITITKDDKGATLYVKNFVISTKQYTQIIKIFEQLLMDYAQKRDALVFANSARGKMIDVEIIDDCDDGYLVKPLNSSGYIDGYKFILTQNKLFHGEHFRVKTRTKVLCKGFNSERKIVVLSRFEQAIALDIFQKCFLECLNSLGKHYSYQSIHVNMNGKTKAITFFVDWDKRPSSFVISWLCKELRSVLGRCNIIYKEVRFAK